MPRPKHLLATLAVIGLTTTAVAAQDFRLSSPSIAEGVHLPLAQVFKGFGCLGENLSPQLAWSGAPKETKSFAITAYDPDAPTGSGWWHWTIVNIPARVSALPAGASGTGAMPTGSMELRNDYGQPGFGGACPPPGEVHRYVFTIFALGVEKLELPETASNALAGYMIRANALRQASITAVYKR